MTAQHWPLPPSIDPPGTDGHTEYDVSCDAINAVARLMLKYGLDPIRAAFTIMAVLDGADRLDPPEAPRDARADAFTAMCVSIQEEIGAAGGARDRFAQAGSEAFEHLAAGELTGDSNETALRAH